MVTDIFDIKGKKIIVTGSKGHLGKPLVDYLRGAGAIIIGLSRSEETSEYSFAVDLSNDVQRQEVIKKIVRKFGTIDGLVNNAYSGKANTIENTKRIDFEQSLEMNLTAPYLLIQDCLEYFSEKSSIVNIASMYGMVSPDPRIYGDSGQNNPVYYGAGKAGMIQMTKYLACHLAMRYIRVNAISPGPFPNFPVEQMNGIFHKELEKKNPMNRIGQPNELWGAVHFLLSNASSYITGVNLPVDGGWTAW